MTNEISSHDLSIVTQSTLLEDGKSSDKKTNSSETKKTNSSEKDEKKTFLLSDEELRRDHDLHFPSTSH